jgi:endogenous inhibitor of DNA gyrase (YacG/DUF329 family)
MAAKCRDCPRCTESVVTSLVMLVPRVAWTLLTLWNIQLFQKRCPQCNHRLKWHAKLADGRFRD